MMTRLSDFATDDVRALTAGELDTVNGGTSHLCTPSELSNSMYDIRIYINAFFYAANMGGPFPCAING